MTKKVFLTSFLILALTSCSVYSKKPNNSPQISTPTTQIATPSVQTMASTVQITKPTPQITTPTIYIGTPTTTQISIPTTCLQYNDASDWSAKVAGTCISSQSREAIIETLVTVWLTHFTSTNVPEEIRLEKFTIDSIDMGGSPNLPVSYKPDFIAVITYSVKPTIALSSTLPSWWVAGDGIPGDDGWVRYKRDYVGIIKNGDFYEIRIWGYSVA